MTVEVRKTTATLHSEVECTEYGDASVNIIHNQHGRTRRREENRTEQNLFVRSGKSKAE